MNLDATVMEVFSMQNRIEGGIVREENLPIHHLPWQERLTAVMEMMREMSSQTDPQQMVQQYGARMRRFRHVDRSISLSRRDLTAPQVRITRYSGWNSEVNPWKQPEKLPILEGGILSELIYADEPRVIDNFEVPPGDPAEEFMAGHRSLVAIPLLDKGVALNMVVHLRREPHAFDPEMLPEHVWTANLFGRATNSLVLAGTVKTAYEEIDRELKAVAAIQRSLLPAKLPQLASLKLAAHYETARRAGGDYYDFIPLPGGLLGILIADVSGHGTPAAVMMAVMHSIVHNYPGDPLPPSQLLTFLNKKLVEHYVGENGTFVTAFYGIFDPATRVLTYSCAGHNPPLMRRCSQQEVFQLDGAQQLPLGVLEDSLFIDRAEQLRPGDQIIFYTDGITEATSPDGEMFGTKRLDNVLSECSSEPAEIIESVRNQLNAHTGGAAPRDDQTLVVARVT
jgi:sigma-B regulation protein RsbU (phosphoserine phosphatase)